MRGDGVLEQIVAATRERVARRRHLVLPERPMEIEPPQRHGFRSALRRATPAEPVRFLCEIKRASPSAGTLRSPFRPEELARDLQTGGASALSVLTEPDFFQGSVEHLRAARLTARLPCLMKDFVVDPFQIEEAVSYGADAVLLIVALLESDRLYQLLDLARIARIDALVEVHDEDELARALEAGAELVGANARDLRTLEVDPELPLRLRPLVPPHVVFVAESGISTPEDVEALSEAGADALLIGEHFMRAANPGAALIELRRVAHDVASRRG
jgi:indole-3-glycerol phosphate synthase